MEKRDFFIVPEAAVGEQRSSKSAMIV